MRTRCGQRGGKCQRPGEKWRPPEHAPGTAIHPMLSGGPGAARWPGHCSLRAVHCSPFEQDRHRCTPANAKEEKGQWDVGACACCERATIASPADRVRLVSQKEIMCRCLGVPRLRARTSVEFALSPDSLLAQKRVPEGKQVRGQDVRVRGCSIGRGGWGAHHDYQEGLRGRG